MLLLLLLLLTILVDRMPLKGNAIPAVDYELEFNDSIDDDNAFVDTCSMILNFLEF